MTAGEEEVRRLVEGEHPDPFQVLGAHRVGADDGRFAVRVFVPGAQSVSVLDASGAARPMERLHPAGFFEALFRPGPVVPYRLEITHEGGTVERNHDPYSFPPLLSDGGPQPLQRGYPPEDRRRARGPPAGFPGRGRGPVCRMGARRPARQRGRRLQYVGRQAPSHARPRRFRGVGDLPSRRGTWRSLQVRDQDPGGAISC